MEKIGLEPLALLTQVINFTIIILVLTKLLYNPILKVLEERKKKIEEGLTAAEEMKKELEKGEKKKQEIINKARDEARQIIEEAKKDGQKLEAEIIGKAHKEAVAVVEKGRKELDGERAAMEKKLKIHTVEIAQSVAEKIIVHVLSNSDQQAFIDKRIKEIGKLARGNK